MIVIMTMLAGRRSGHDHEDEDGGGDDHDYDDVGREEVRWS